MRKCFKKYIRKIGNKNDNDVAADVAQQEHKIGRASCRERVLVAV